ncbi:MAG: UbiH/UbiF family hydroxylase [Pseudomonadota bacterium]
MTETCDILISGGGIAGLAAAALFGRHGFHVILVDPAPPVTDGDADGADLRTTALLQPARTLFDAAGVWDAIAPHGAALEIMQIVDAGDSPGARRATRAFKSSDVSDLPFGWNVPNWRLRQVLVDRLGTLDTVDFRPGLSATQLFTRLNEARVTLSDGTRIRTRLVIAADGRNSVMRTAAGIGVTTRRYGQKALAFAVTHPEPHDNISTEIHKTGGPFTFVPLPDHDGQPCSAVVWMDDGAKSLARLNAPVTEFESEATDRSSGLLGPLRLATRRSLWPIISQKADRFAAQRVALVAEAAHVVPPIGAQGLNMSLADIRTLFDLAEQSPGTLGDAQMLDAYHRARFADVSLRVAGIDMLNRTSQAAAPALRTARAWGVTALHEVKPVRKTLMRMGLGTN